MEATASDQALWPELAPGAELTIVKIGPDGREVTRYPGWSFATGTHAPWIAARSEWVKRLIEMDGLRFVPGDCLHEFFSIEHWFNLFSVFSPSGELRGWYANVTRPTTFTVEGDRVSLFWHDLYVDVVALPSGHAVVRDEDELAESGLIRSDPVLHARILRTRDELLQLFETRTFPFHESSENPGGS